MPHESLQQIWEEGYFFSRGVDEGLFTTHACVQTVIGLRLKAQYGVHPNTRPLPTLRNPPITTGRVVHEQAKLQYIPSPITAEDY